MPARTVVLASGGGTLLQAMLDALGSNYPATVVAVGSDRHDAGALERAERAGVPTFVLRLGDCPDRAAWDHTLTKMVAEYEPDLIVLAGFMKLVGPAFLARFGGRVINSHPALLPAFPGANAVRDALAYGVKVTGCSVLLVDDGVDSGPVVAQQPVWVEQNDTEDTLHERIKVVERGLLVDVVAALARHGCTVSGRKVSIP